MSNADSLTPASRSLYESTRKKMFASIFTASLALMCLAYVSVYGGLSDASRNYAASSAGAHDDSIYRGQIAESGGYGFGAFVFFVAFATFISAAVYISPMYCGSPNEKKMVKGPQEVELDAFQQYATGNPVHGGSGHGHSRLPGDEV